MIFNRITKLNEKNSSPKRKSWPLLSRRIYEAVREVRPMGSSFLYHPYANDTIIMLRKETLTC